MKELLIRTLTGITLIILVIGSILLGPIPFLGIVLIIFGLGLKELFSVYHQGRSLPGIMMAVSAGVLMPVAFAVQELQWSLLWFLLPAVGWMIGLLWSGFSTIGMLIFFWLAIPLTSFYSLGWVDDKTEYYSFFPLSVIVLVWINDTFAYLAGSLIGKHKMTPRLSPGKTWEGFAGGILFTLLGGWIIFRNSGKYTTGIWIMFSLIIGSLGFMGDLFESNLKRKMNVKNMGGLLPGHGGVLDRFDSLLLVAPVLFIITIILNLMQ